MKILKTIMLMLLAQISFAQVKTIALDKRSIPASIKYVGKIIKAVKYTDSYGDHIIITTETGETKSKGQESEDWRSAALYAYSYDMKDGNPKLIWQVHDFVNDCPVDMFANYLPNTFAVTDLNKDSKAEVWLMYKTVCHGDVSPSNMKIIMYEANKKYAVRGQNKVIAGGVNYGGGKYTFDQAFLSGPAVFRDYALQLWKKNLMETRK